MRGLLIPTLMTMVLNLLYTFVALWLGVIMLKLVDKHIYPKINFEEEVKQGNVAVSVVVAALILFIAIVVSSGLRG